MKKILTICLALGLVMVLMQSCGAYYEYVQVISTKPANNIEETTKANGGMLYEDDQCAVFYKFWGEGGNAGFEFYNKTDQIIYLDLSKTFFIKNGVAHDYYVDKTVTDTETSHTTSGFGLGYGLAAARGYSSSISQYYAGSVINPGVVAVSLVGRLLFGNAFSSTFSTSTTMGHSQSVAITDQPILAIPPKSSKFVKNFSILSSEIVSCDLRYYPEESDAVQYTAENSPLVFSNYITYTIGGDTTLRNVENKFYVSEIANYAEQEAVEYVEREKICENVLTPVEVKNQKYQRTLYDRYINKGDESSFYFKYKVYSSAKIYQKEYSGYIWYSTYEGYIKQGSNSNSSNASTSNPYLQPSY